MPELTAGHRFRFGAYAAMTLSNTTICFASDRTGNYEIYVMDLVTNQPLQLTDNPLYDSWWPRISPNRGSILFYRTPRGTLDQDATKNELWLMETTGRTQVRVLPAGAYGWQAHGHAEWWPDQSKFVMQGG